MMARMRSLSMLGLSLLPAAVAVAAILAPSARADDYVDVCPSGLSGVATYDTSCGFADNVRAAFYGQPGWTVFAYSPATGKFYTMQCGRAWTTNSWVDPKKCYGINEYGTPLVVYIA